MACSVWGSLCHMCIQLVRAEVFSALHRTAHSPENHTLGTLPTCDDVCAQPDREGNQLKCFPRYDTLQYRVTQHDIVWVTEGLGKSLCVSQTGPSVCLYPASELETLSAFLNAQKSLTSKCHFPLVSSVVLSSCGGDEITRLGWRQGIARDADGEGLPHFGQNINTPRSENSHAGEIINPCTVCEVSVKFCVCICVCAYECIYVDHNLGL